MFLKLHTQCSHRRSRETHSTHTPTSPKVVRAHIIYEFKFEEFSFNDAKFSLLFSSCLGPSIIIQFLCALLARFQMPPLMCCISCLYLYIIPTESLVYWKENEERRRSRSIGAAAELRYLDFDWSEEHSRSMMIGCLEIYKVFCEQARQKKCLKGSFKQEQRSGMQFLHFLFFPFFLTSYFARCSNVLLTAAASSSQSAGSI